MSDRNLFPAAAALIAACGSGDPSDRRPSPAAVVPAAGGARGSGAAVGVRLVDSAQTGGELGMEEVVSYRVEVAAGARRDTLAGVRVQRVPVLAPDGAVHGVAVGPEGEAAGTFRFDPATRALARTPAPADASPFFSELTLSPDGRHVAYVAQESRPVARLWGAVRAWPGGRLVARAARRRATRRTSTTAGCAGPGRTRTRWCTGSTASRARTPRWPPARGCACGARRAAAGHPAWTRSPPSPGPTRREPGGGGARAA
jgi:hypothetical protein